MQISNTYKKRFVSALVLLTMLTGAGYITGELLKPVHYARQIYNAEYNELKKNKTKVDLIFVGASRDLVAFNPKIFEEKLHLDKVFNLSLSQQNMQDSYFQLKEFLEEFHPKTVVLGISHGRLIAKARPRIVRMQTAERLHGLNCIEYIKKSFAINEYPDIIPLYGYRGNVNRIKQNIKERLQYQKEGVYMKTLFWQSHGQGFASYPKSVPVGNMGIERLKFDKAMIQPDTIYYLDKCVQLCKANNVRLFLTTPPASAAFIFEINSYQNVIDYINNYANKNNLTYHNLNYLKGKEEWLSDSMLYDHKHLNKTGSDNTSEKYAEILSKSLNNIDVSDSFYSSFAEMQKSVKRIASVDAKPVIKMNMMTLQVQSLQNKGVVPSYQVLLAKTKNDFKPVVDWTGKNNVSFPVPTGSQYRVLLRARQNTNDSNYAWMAWEVNKAGKIRKLKNVPVNGV